MSHLNLWNQLAVLISVILILVGFALDSTFLIAGGSLILLAQALDFRFKVQGSKVRQSTFDAFKKVYWRYIAPVCMAAVIIFGLETNEGWREIGLAAILVIIGLLTAYILILRREREIVG
jgi:hypothetical protein